MTPGDLLTLDVEKAVAGGQMLARHDGRVVLIWGAIPGERVSARIDRIVKGTAHATVVSVAESSPDRTAETEWRCGGNVYAHVAYQRQLRIKVEVVVDALRRIGKIDLPEPPSMVASPQTHGYRMRMRLHTANGRVGFYREGSHDLCDPEVTGQLLPATVAWLRRLEPQLQHATSTDVVGIEVTENVPGTERVCHVEVRTGGRHDALMRVAHDEALTGFAVTVAQPGCTQRFGLLTGLSTVADVLSIARGGVTATLRLRRDVRAFFQGNRFLLERLTTHVVNLVPDGPVVDLYAGVGLFGLALAVSGAGPVTVVEGDVVSGGDLSANAEACEGGVDVRRTSVEAFMGAPSRQHAAAAPEATWIVDPPRSGMSPAAVHALVDRRPRQLVIVSCDPATLARDLRRFVDVGYAVDTLTLFDLFPATAHVESVASLRRV